jgi:hypothetical protein
MVLVTVAFLCLGSSLLLSFAALPTAFSAFFFCVLLFSQFLR